ncbi:hypothetical protein GCM10009722_27240 [Williamsia deligens]
MTRQRATCASRGWAVLGALVFTVAVFLPVDASAAPYPPVPPTVAVSSAVVPGAASLVPATPASDKVYVAPGEWPVQAPTGAGSPDVRRDLPGWGLTAGLIAGLGAVLLVRLVRRS